MSLQHFYGSSGRHIMVSNVMMLFMMMATLMKSSLTAEARTATFVITTPMLLPQRRRRTTTTTTTTIRPLKENKGSLSFYPRSTATTRNHDSSVIGSCRMTNNKNDNNDDSFDRHIDIKEEESETNDVNTSNGDDDKDDESTSDMNKSLDWVTLTELAEMEERASKRNWDQLMLPNRIGEAIGNTLQFLALSFLISNYALPYFGYAYIPILDDAEDTTISRRSHRPRFTIGTLEERDFIMEIKKSNKEQQQQQQR